MARPAHTLIQFSGLLGPAGGSVEAFSMALRATGGVTFNQGNLESAASACMGAWTDNFATALGDNVALTKVVVAPVDSTGHWQTTADGAYVKGDWEGTIRGAHTDASPLPAQAALCISLNTARAGASGKGRFFLPLGRADLQVDGRIPSNGAEFWAGQAAGFIQDLNTIVGDIAVVSSKGYASKVTAVRVGRVIDTIRSRRADIPEEYALVAVPT